MRSLLIRLVPCALLAAAAFASCDREPPPPNLRFRMFSVEVASRTMAPLLARPDQYGTVAEGAATIAEVAADPAFERYERKPSYRLPAEELDKFRSFRRQLGERARALQQAAEAGDVAGVQRGYAQLQMTCQVCHAAFRPGL